ncbi:hypothetical protein AB1Y20_004380 [Prymnesium parvum]|uniref:Dipeptidase n=1 Tax=Prymnesium parvum TaxID=97485 RepID=A0AB34IZ61_PRYPA
MVNHTRLTAITAVLCMALLPVTLGCTAIGVTPSASADGSVLVSHSSDAEGAGDPRLYRVGAAEYAAGELRPVHKQYVGFGERLQPPQVLGYIPQVGRTYAYMREAYGAINEKQVLLGESTTSSIAPVDGWAKPRDEGGAAIFGIQPLTEIALERCDTARCAVQTMGQLAEEYGFYQDDGTPTGEAIVAGDKQEVWVFHVLPDPTGKSAVWAAAKVPDGEVVVVSNMFVIRDVDLSKPDDYMASRNLYDVARDVCGWDPADPFDFTRLFSAPANGGEYGGKYYSGRRLWRAYSLLSPRASLPAAYDSLAASRPYPFSLRVDAKSIGIALVTRVHRDALQGTPFDLTKGLAAGPWGTPHRFAFPSESFPRWERPISIYRCAASYVAQARAWLPDLAGATIWFGPHVPHGTFYVPFAVGMPALPPSYTEFNMLALDRSSAYWAHAAVQALAEARFAWISREVAAMQARVEGGFLAVQAAADRAFLKTGDAAAMAAEYYANAEWVADLSWRFHDALVYRYADGFVRAAVKAPTPISFADAQLSPPGMGVPSAWLDAIDYSTNDGDAPPGAALPHKPQPATAQLQPADVVPLADAAFPLAPPPSRPLRTTALAAAAAAAAPLPSFPAAALCGALLLGALLGAALTASLAPRRAAAAASARWGASRWLAPVTPAKLADDRAYVPFAEHMAAPR